jgi:hypothetical protein
MRDDVGVCRLPICATLCVYYRYSSMFVINRFPSFNECKTTVFYTRLYEII